ncbi:hypothetical protein PP707_04155 [Acetobacter pasteurianus]|nr:hypothetical protein [Acetobacter pasteurianus]
MTSAALPLELGGYNFTQKMVKKLYTTKPIRIAEPQVKIKHIGSF